MDEGHSKDGTYCYEQSIAQIDTARVPPIRIFMRLLSFILRKQSLIFVLYIALSIGSGLLMPFTISKWKKYIDLAEHAGQMASLFTGALGALWIYILLSALQSVCRTAMENVSARFNFASWFSMDKEINIKAMGLEPEFFEIPKTQAMIDRAWYFTRAGFVLIFQLGLMVFSSISAVTGLLVSMYLLDRRICLVSTLTIIPAILGKFVSDRESFEKEQKTSVEMLEYNYFKDIFTDKQLYREIKLNGRMAFFTKKFEDKSRTILEIRQKCFKKKAAFLFAGSFSQNAILIVCLFMAVCGMVDGTITIGGFAAIFKLIAELIKSMTDMVSRVTSIITSSYSVNEFFKFIDLKKAETEKAGENKETEKGIAEQGCLELDHVFFRYPLSDRLVLEDIDLKIKKGEHVAVVGANGSGKSTFIKLITRMVEPSCGTVRLGGKDIMEISPEDYWHHFAAVFQDYNKYKESLGYNVFISDISRKEQENQIREALAFAGFQKNIPLDTVLSTEFGGIDLSGGEWQKVAIARAFFGNKDIVILDEPTAAIDPLKEAEIYDAFDKIGKGKTVFFVTHRLGSVLSADRILFFEDGRIVENGTHQELLSLHGRYAGFWQAQAGLYQ